MKLVAASIGFCYTLVCEAIALMMVGGGHGWLTPFFWGWLGLLIFPFCIYAFLDSRSQGQGSIFPLILALGMTAVSDLLLLGETLDEGLQYFERVGEFAWVWVSVWALGHLPLILAALVHLHKRLRREA